MLIMLIYFGKTKNIKYVIIKDQKKSKSGSKANILKI